jgi:hypothetical protein
MPTHKHITPSPPTPSSQPAPPSMILKPVPQSSSPLPQHNLSIRRNRKLTVSKSLFHLETYAIESYRNVEASSLQSLCPRSLIRKNSRHFPLQYTATLCKCFLAKWSLSLFPTTHKISPGSKPLEVRHTPEGARWRSTMGGVTMAGGS